MSLNDFVIMQKLGSGSFASVYKARRLIDQQIYALKKIDLKALGTKEKNNALNEIRLLACLSSPYIIGYCESFFDEKLDLLTIAMEYANEGDLLKKIEKQKKLRSLMPEVQVWKILIHLLYGLNELHSKNILHRDLKAQNIFIGNGIYKIGDMNVSKIIKNGLACTQTGTPYYASPEVWNDQPYNQKSDIWSLGCILYQVATLRPPYEASSMQKLFDMVTRCPTPKIPTNYSRELQMIINSCLQKNPGNRPSTKDLLSNQTLKIYENLVVEFKPEVGNFKEPLLKTIYMPNSKRELKNQLPQSNYKSSQKNLLKEENQAESTNKQEEKTCKQIDQPRITPNTQIKQFSDQKPSQIQPVLLNIDNFVRQNDSSKKQQPFKQRNRIQSCKIFRDVSSKKLNSKQNLMARADFIIESQRKPHQEKKHVQTAQSAIISKKTEQKSSQKQNIIQSLAQYNKNQNRQIHIEDEEIIVPKRLIFDEPVSSNSKQTFENLIEQKKSKDNECQISNQPYLLDTLKNVSVISQKNHSQYRFDTQQVTNQPITETNQQNLEENTSVKKEEQTSQNTLQTNKLSQLKPVNIIIDVKENQKVIQPPNISPVNKMTVKLGVQKIKNITHNIIFKSKIFVFNSLRNQLLRLRMVAKQQEIQLKLYHQSHKDIKETLNHQPKTHQQKTPSKTFQKRSRSKSIRKTQKCKPLHSQAKEDTDFALIDKINRKISIESTQKVEVKQKSAKKENKNKKIFDKENISTEHGFESTYQQKLKQMALIPKSIRSSSGHKSSSKQKKQNKQSYPATSKKDKQSVLKVLDSNNLMPNHRSDRKLILQGMCSFQQKKKKIFQNTNPVYNVSDKLDRINLEKKMKRYINF